MLIELQSAWDNYIASNAAMDPSIGNMWPMNLDIDSMGTPSSNQNSQQSTTGNPGSVFMGSMGATTPGGSNNMGL